MSRFRYHNAERWMTTLEADFLIEPRHAKEALHQAGFVTQQALCAYLLDMGFADAWNARHIKQDIAKALAYANACGFGHHCPDMARLAAVLSPYWKWGYHYHDWEEDRPRIWRPAGLARRLPPMPTSTWCIRPRRARTRGAS